MLNTIKWLFEGPISHRGLHSKTCPENSILAFEKSVGKGYAIELDVQVMKDNTVVVFHDSSLKRMTGKYGIIQNMKYDDIKPLLLNGTNEHIPTLDEVLRVVDGKVPLLIEIKQLRKREQVKLVLEKLQDYVGEYAIQSFDPFILMKVKRTDPSIIRGQLSSHFNKDDMSKIRKKLLSKLFFNKFTKPHFISYNVDDLPDKHVAKQGLPILAWVVRSQEQYTDVKQYCDNIIFENFEPKI